MATTTKSTEQWRMKASEYIQDKIVEQENRIVEMEKLMEHGKHFVAARLESHNEFGTFRRPDESFDPRHFHLSTSHYPYYPAYIHRF